MQVSKSVSTDALMKRVITLAATRIAGKSDDKIDARYTKTVAEVAKRTKKSPQQIRTLARRRARSSEE